MRAIETVQRERHSDPLIDLADWLRSTAAGLPFASIGSGSFAGVRQIELPRDANAAIEATDALVDEGARLLFVAADETPVVDRALIALLTHKDAARVTVDFDPQHDDLDAWAADTRAVSNCVWSHRGHLDDMERLPASMGSAVVHAMTQVLLTAAARRTPVLISGVAASAAALLAQRLDRRSSGWLALASANSDAATVSAQERLSLSTVFSSRLPSGRSESAFAYAQISALLALDS